MNVPSFGDPDYSYEGPASLIVAVEAFPTRFSDETKALVAQLLKQLCEVEQSLEQHAD